MYRVGLVFTNRSPDSHQNELVQNLVRRQAHSVLLDPYANAFQYNGSTPGEHQIDSVVPPMSWAVFESKYELDSVAAFLKLSNAVHNATGGTADCFDETWERAVALALDTIEDQQVGGMVGLRGRFGGGGGGRETCAPRGAGGNP